MRSFIFDAVLPSSSAGKTAFLSPEYLSEKLRISPLVIGSSHSETRYLSPSFMHAQLISRKSVRAFSTITLSSYLNALSSAALSVKPFFAMLIPMLLPRLAGLTITG